MGEKFGLLTVIALNKHDPRRGSYFFSCKCECGSLVVVREDCLKSGNTKSCGCLFLSTRNRKHGMWKTRTYGIWAGMKYRCHAFDSKKSHLYAAKGVKVCKRWMKFENFLDDMGEAPEGLSIDRINGNGNYEPANCSDTR